MQFIPGAPLANSDAAPAAPVSVFDDMMVNYGPVFTPSAATAPACDAPPTLFPPGTPSSSTLADPSYAGDLAYYPPAPAPAREALAQSVPQGVPPALASSALPLQSTADNAPPAPAPVPALPPQPQQQQQQQQQQLQETVGPKTLRPRGGESSAAPRPRKRRSRAADDDTAEPVPPEDAGTGSGRGSPLDPKERKAAETKKTRSRGPSKRPVRVTGPRGSASSSALCVSPSAFAGSPQVSASNAPMFGGGYPDMVTKQAKLYEVLDQAIGDHVDLTQSSAMVPSILQLYTFLKFVSILSFCFAHFCWSSPPCFLSQCSCPSASSPRWKVNNVLPALPSQFVVVFHSFHFFFFSFI